MDTGKHHLLQPAYGILKKAVIYFSCVKYFQTFAFFFLPRQWTSFHLINMLNPVKDVLFNKIKLAHHLL